MPRLAVSAGGRDREDDDEDDWLLRSWEPCCWSCWITSRGSRVWSRTSPILFSSSLLSSVSSDESKKTLMAWLEGGRTEWEDGVGGGW